jgi:Metal-independent alpha-mannosidase (GH125)
VRELDTRVERHQRSLVQAERTLSEVRAALERAELRRDAAESGSHAWPVRNRHVRALTADELLQLRAWLGDSRAWPRRTSESGPRAASPMDIEWLALRLQQESGGDDEDVVSESVRWQQESVRALLAERGWHKLAAVWNNTYVNTLATTTQRVPEDNSTFVFTGDIHAMWLRDAAAQVHQYLPLTRVDPGLRTLIEGVLRRMQMYIGDNPYANSFRYKKRRAHRPSTPGRKGGSVATPDYEVDSLCYFLWLSHDLWVASGSVCHAAHPAWLRTLRLIVEQLRTEQEHTRLASPYAVNFLPPERYTGMTWSSHRPSDDQQQLPYLVPSNMFCVVALRQALALLDALGHASLAVCPSAAVRAFTAGQCPRLALTCTVRECSLSVTVCPCLFAGLSFVLEVLSRVSMTPLQVAVLRWRCVSLLWWHWLLCGVCQLGGPVVVFLSARVTFFFFKCLCGAFAFPVCSLSFSHLHFSSAPGLHAPVCQTPLSCEVCARASSR